MNEQRVLADLDFPEPCDVRGRSSIADLIEPGQRCGIYVLHFADGEYYVGKSVNVTGRFTDHRKKYPDIVRISFRLVSKPMQKEVETRTIETLEQEGFLLRNRTDTSIPKGESDFDKIMSAGDQQRWLHDFNVIDGKGPRREEPELRRKHRGEFEKLMEKPHATELVQLLRTYVQLGIPAFRRSEVWFWSITCFPGTTDIFARININWQEVCTVHCDGNKRFDLQIASSPLKDYSWFEKLKLRFRYPLHIRTNHRYRTGGPDQLHIGLPARYVETFIQEPHILTAIRLFNWRLMKKGPNNPNNIQAHCMDLADKLI